MSLVISDRAELKRYCDKQREAGAVLVFTNGVFDLLHAGHLQSLAKAKAEGDILIVGINDDDSVRRLKGAGRPILPIDQRLELVAEIEYVGAAVPFHEDTPEALLELIRPAVLVKGGQYSIEEIVGHEIVLGYGGRVVPIPMKENRSTTNIVEEIKRRYATTVK